MHSSLKLLRNVANRSSSEEESDIRPNAIISTLIQHDIGYPIAFGEVKPGNSSTTKHSVCMDILRLGIASKRAIDKWHLGWLSRDYDQWLLYLLLRCS